MASTSGYASGGGSSTGGSSRRRARIDDVRQLQQERRRRQATQHQHEMMEQQPQYQYHMEDDMAHNNMQHRQPNQCNGDNYGGYTSDANTTLTSTINSGHHGDDEHGGTSILRSPASSTRSSRSSSRLSAKRHNMMQRRIEMRRRNEARQREQKQQQEQNERELVHQNISGRDQAAVPPHQHQWQQQQQQQQQRRPQHYHHPQPNASQQHVHQSIGQVHLQQVHQTYEQNQQVHLPPLRQPHASAMQNNGHHSQNGGYYHPQSAPYNQQQSYEQSQNRMAQQQQQQQQQVQYTRSQSTPPTVIPSPPAVQRNQRPQRNDMDRVMPRYQMQPTGEGGRSNTQQQQQQQHPRMNHTNPRVYDRADLERSGIIRNSGGHYHEGEQRQQQHQQQPPLRQRQVSNQATNRMGNYGAPSDEWSGYNNNANHRVHVRDAGMSWLQQQQQQQQQQQHADQCGQDNEQHGRYQQSQQPPQGPQQHHAVQTHHNNARKRQQPRLKLGSNHGQHSAVEDHMQGNDYSRDVHVAPRERHRPPHQQPQQQHRQVKQEPSPRQEQGGESARIHRPPRQMPPREQCQDQIAQHEPNWSEVNQLYRDDNRQRVYQRQLASRRQYQERHRHQQQQQQVVGAEQVMEGEQTAQPQHVESELESAQPQQQQQQLLAQQRMSKSQSPSRRSISTFSPVEHLGNRTDHIQRKNIDNSPSRVRHHPPSIPPMQQPNHNDGYNDLEGEGSIVSVSEQARKFETSRRRRNEHDQAALPHQQQQQQDEETISVASIRKGWEKSQRSKPTPDKSNGSSPFGVWEERANRLTRLRRREQRREQRKNIEDRWMNQHRTTVKSLPLPEKRGIGNGLSQQQGTRRASQGYRSEDERLSARHVNRSNCSFERYGDGYQSEGQELNRGRRSRYQQHSSLYQSAEERKVNHHDDEASAQEGQEVALAYDGHHAAGSDLIDNVDADAITPQDARRKLWDTKERLRAVLPRDESYDDIGDVRDRWPEQQHDNNSAPPPPQVVNHNVMATSPRSNYSCASSQAGSLFKSKFVHAAALATQQRRSVGDGLVQGQDAERGYHTSSREEHEEHEREYVVEEIVEGEYQVVEKEKRPETVRQAFQHEHRRQQPREYSSNTKGYPHKGAAASSHYTDSTAETTADVTGIHSFGSSNRGSARGSSANAVQCRSNNATRPTTNFVRRVSPSPPKRASSSMPPIDERGDVVPPPHQAQTQTSVSELISRINAVSRADPEEALAAIDSIIKGEGGANGGSGVPATTSRQVSRRKFSPVVPTPPTKAGSSPFSPSRNNITVTPPSNNKANGKNESAAVRHLGKDFFQEKYEEVLRNDSAQILRDANPTSPYLEMSDEHHHAAVEDLQEEDSDDDDSLLSSDDSTVSSMTNPTYQSIRSEHVRHRKHQHHRHHQEQRQLPPSVRGRSPRRPSAGNPVSSQHPDTIRPQKSWNTLRREYNVRKTSPLRQREMDENNGVINAKSSSSEGDLGLDSFNPDVDEVPEDEYQQEYKQEQPPKMEQPQTLSKSGTNELSTGFCGMNYHVAIKEPGPKSRSNEGEAPEDRVTSNTQDNTAWEPNPDSDDLFGNNKQRRSNTVSTGGRASPNERQVGRTSQESTSDEWPFTGSHPPRRRSPSSFERRNSKTQQAQPSQTPPSWANNTQRDRVTTPEMSKQQAVPKIRASTPEIMAAVSDAFSNVDISLDGVEESHPIISTDEDPPLQHLTSSEGEEDEPLQSIAEAFSDVDVSFDQQEKTVSQRRKELEYLARSWTASKSQSQEGSSSSSSWLKQNASATKSPTAAAAAPTWANGSSPQKRSRATTTKIKKKNEPTLRLKGNKTLAQKFSNLVKAYGD